MDSWGGWFSVALMLPRPVLGFFIVSSVCDTTAFLGLEPEGDCDAQKSSSHVTDTMLLLPSTSSSASEDKNALQQLICSRSLEHSMYAMARL